MGIDWSNRLTLVCMASLSAAGSGCAGGAVKPDTEGGQWREALAKFAEGHLAHSAWGPSHARRVIKLSLELASEERLTVDEEVLFAAGYLHDLGAIEPYRVAAVDHAARSVSLCGDVLVSLGFPAAKIPLVQEVIRGHMFDATPGTSSEARCFHDADALDFLGAIGLVRLVSLTERHRWAPDLAGAIEKVRSGAQNLPSAVVTAAARRRAVERAAETSAFLAALARESGEFHDL